MITLILMLVILGVIFYCVDMIPMAPPFPTLIRVAAVIIGVVYILQFLGVNLPILHM